MTPQRAPTNSFSACWQSKASFVRSIWVSAIELGRTDLGSIEIGSIGLRPIEIGPTDLGSIARLFGQIEQGVADGHLHRSGGAQSRTLRHVPLHQQVRATQLLTRPR